jgi:signal transduction histidine kinase
MSNSSLVNKITRAFILQGALIIVTAILSVFFASFVINEILIKSALNEEANYYWSRYQQNKAASLPATLNLTGYLEPEDIREIPQGKVPVENGFYEYTEQNLVLFVTSKNETLLYLIYNRGQVDSLATFYGLFPLALVLVVLYLALWLTYRFSRRTLSPVIKLAEQVNQIDFTSSDLPQLESDIINYESDDDIRVLHDAIVHMRERLESFIMRERNFTRDASHELRSPLTVINIAADMLLSEQQLSMPVQNTVHRIKRAINDMEELTSAFLLLARESDKSLSRNLVCVNDVIIEQIDRSILLKQKKDIEIHFNPPKKLYTHASDKVLSILIGNLIRNAILYTEQGQVDITINENRVYISDSGKGMDQKEVKEIFKPYYRGSSNGSHGHGVGLTIVKRLSERFNWPITIDSFPEQGTTVTVEFPDFQFHE